MKLTFFMFLTALLQVSASSFAQKITLNKTNAQLTDVLNDVRLQSGYSILYDVRIMKNASAVNVHLNNASLEEALNQCFAGQPFNYVTNGKTIVVTPDKKSTTTLNQAVVVSGKVTDERGEPLPGVTIRVKGSNLATTTNAKGLFTLNLPSATAVLTFTSVGFVAQEITVGSQTTINVQLKEQTNTLSETVVVGYGTQKKINQVGAISSIGTKELVQSPAANISNSLVGRLPGLFASQAGGEPGNDASTIRIRGVGTFTGNTDPLILVDGIEVISYNNIDPNEIASLTILKDASSTAVYGIRGANGVIIITTKRGKAGPPKISYSFNQAINSFTALRNSMNSADYARSSNEAQLLDSYVTNSAYSPTYSAADIALYESGADPIFHPNVNWYDKLFKKTSLQSQHNLSVSGGQQSVRYFISGGLFSQDGLFKDTKDIISEFSAQSTYKRYNFRSNFNFDATKRLKIALDLSSQSENRSGNNLGDVNVSSADATKRLVGDIGRASPLGTPGVVDGKIVNLTTGVTNNPYVSLLAGGAGGGLRREYNNVLNGSLRADHDLDFITKGLRTHADVAFTTYNNQRIINQKSVPIYVATKYPDGSINYVPIASSATPQFSFIQNETNTRRITAEFGLDYDRTFKNHNITGLLLYNQQKTYDPALQFLIPKGYQSLVGRLTYAYKSRYLAEFDGGYNGTENFAPGKRFGFFPAFSAGWVPSEESFFPKNKIVNYLKIRGSYGEVGNDNIGNNRFLYNSTSYSYVGNIYYLGVYGTNYNAYQGAVENRAGNPNVTWERSKKTDIGLDMYMFSEKFKITADYFNEDRSNILSTPNSISGDAGIIQPAVNLGRMNNRGFDGEISYTGNLREFNYRVSANYSFARNKILFQDEIPFPYSYQNRTGHRFGQYYGVIVDGIYNTWAEVNDAARPVYPGNNKVQPGDFKYRDVNGDGRIDDNDQVPVGYSNIPEKTYGISLSGSYKGFDISVLFQGVSNVSISYTRFQRSTNFGGSPPEGAASYLIESWTPERYAAGLPISFPRLSYTGSNNPNQLNSDFFKADASYLRLKNVELGYTLKASLLKKAGIGSARIYTNANNLYTWSGVYKGIDPENLPSTDTNQENYPLVRTINFGINVNF